MEKRFPLNTTADKMSTSGHPDFSNIRYKYMVVPEFQLLNRFAQHSKQFIT